jgi:CTP:molybdopterin cytidylyltransferase MocA
MLAGLILAGGMGERWGGPKAWATLHDGTTFLEACANLLDGAGALRTVATLPPGSLHPVDSAIEVVPLSEPGLDMFASLEVGLRHLIQYEDWRVVAVQPVDHPLVSAATVRALAEAARPAAVPSFRGKHGHPVCLDRDLASAVACGEIAGPTMRDVLREMGARDVRVEDAGVVVNCNTPEALRAALEALNTES